MRRFNGWLGGNQGEGAKAEVCGTCGCLLPPYDVNAQKLHAEWHLRSES